MPGFRAVMAGAVCGGVDPQGLVDRRALVRYAPAATVLEPDGVTLVELQAWQGRPGGAVTPPVAVMTRAAMALPTGTKGPGTDVTLRWSDRGWTGEPDDPDRPNVRYRGLLAEPVRIDRVGPVLPEAPRRVVTTARIVLLNRDGRFDRADRDFAIAGRRLTIKRGPNQTAPRAQWRDFADVAVLRAARWQISAREAAIELEDTAQRLRVPFQTRVYLGTGGSEGPAEWAGRRMPKPLGWKAGIRPDLVDEGEGINKFRYGDGALPYIAAQLSDRGGVFTNLGDTASEAALDAVSLSGAQMAYCSSENLLRVGGLNAGYQLRLTVRPGPGAPGTHGELLEHLWRDVAALRGDEYWPASLALLPAGAAGDYAPSLDPEGEGPTVEQMTERVCNSAFAEWGDDEAGRLRVWVLQPLTGSAATTLDSGDLRSEPLLLPPLEVPRREQRVTWRERSEPVTELVAEADAPEEADRYQVSDAASEALLSKWPTAGVRLHRSLYYDKAEADALAVRIRDVLGDHRLVEAELGRAAWLLARHDETRLGHDRLGLAAAEGWRVVQQSLTGDRGTAVLYRKNED